MSIPELSIMEDLSVTKALMTTYTIVILYFVVKLLGHWYKWYSVPGPWGVPILGYYPFLPENVHIHLKDLSRKFGEVYGFSMLGRLFIVINSVQVYKEMINNQPELPFRPREYGVMIQHQVQGVTSVNGPQWKFLRSFMTRSLARIGMHSSGKHRKSSNIQKTLQNVLADLQKHDGSDIDVEPILVSAFSIILFPLLFGHHTPKDLTEKHLIREYTNILSGQDTFSALLFGPLARYVLLPRRPYYKNFLTRVTNMHELVRQLVEDHKTTLDLDHPRDLIDCFLIERAKLQKNGNLQASYMNDDVIVSTLAENYGDGVVFAGLFCAALLKDISRRREVQDMMHEEIRNEIGLDRLPTWDDRKKLVQTFSTFKEMLRMTDAITLLTSLRLREEINLSGITIPKDSILILSMWNLHRDSEAFEKPYEFNPLRFLSNADDSCGTWDNLYTFGIGKRACLGKPFLMMAMFLIVVTIMQHFILESIERSGKKQLDVPHVCNIRVTARTR